MPPALQLLHCLRSRAYSQLAFTMSSVDGSRPSDQKDPVLLTKYGWPETRRQFEKLITLTSEEYDQKALAFFKKYKNPNTPEQFEKLVALTRVSCEKLLEHISIKGIVQGRTKKCKSLKEKLKLPNEISDEDDNDEVDADDEANAEEADAESKEADADASNKNGEVPNIRDWICKGKNIYKHPEMGDLAGVRIGLYFPDDVRKVALEIEKYFRKKHRYGTVKGGRNATQGRNLDPQGHLTIGAWVSPGPDGADEHWEHYGYRSWQVVVQWKEDLLEPLESEGLSENLKSLREKMPKGFKSLKVEIQVGTVVSQAWAEVQHNIIYKNPDDVLATPTMKRMIDSINGLAITTDIILNELEQSLEKAKMLIPKMRMEARLDRQNNELESLKMNYISEFEQREDQDSQRWVRSWHEANDLLNTLRQANQGHGIAVGGNDVEKLSEKFLDLDQGAFDFDNREIHGMINEIPHMT